MKAPSWHAEFDRKITTPSNALVELSNNNAKSNQVICRNPPLHCMPRRSKWVPTQTRTAETNQSDTPPSARPWLRTSERAGGNSNVRDVSSPQPQTATKADLRDREKHTTQRTQPNTYRTHAVSPSLLGDGNPICGVLSLPDFPAPAAMN